jgi:hypothetical protein
VLALREIDGKTGEDIWMLSLPDRTVREFLATPANEGNAQFSPAGGAIAYQSDQSGRYEVYVQAYPGAGVSLPVSVGGGIEPVWAPDGRTLYYRQGPRLLAVAVQTVPALKAGTPKELFRRDYYSNSNLQSPVYAVHPDGDRFIMIKEGSRQPVEAAEVILNWFQSLGGA